MKIVKDINKHIFRGYDIRGIYGTDITEDTAYTIGKAFGSYILEIGKKVAVIGKDNRASSESLADAIIQGVTSTGVDVVDLGLVTTPMYYFSWELLNIPSGIMVTASHNPKEYNGFKFAFDESGNTYGEKIQEFRKYIERGNFVDGSGNVSKENVVNAYLERIKGGITIGNKKIKVVVDPGNGTSTVIVKQIFNMFDIDTVYICDENDSNFPNHHPDPSVEENLTMLKEKVLEVKADLGLAIDGDADRIGVVDEKGNIIPTDMYMIILWRYIFNKVDKRCALFDVKCTKALEDEMLRLGGTFERYRVGNSYIKAKMKENKYALGGELSGHVFFKDKWTGFDDGIYAGLRLIEVMSSTGKTISQMLEGTSKYYSTPEIKVKASEDNKFNLVESVRKYALSKGYAVNDIDGVRVEFEDSWILVRASQTGPEVQLRCEANTSKRLDDLKNEFMKVIEEGVKNV